VAVLFTTDSPALVVVARAGDVTLDAGMVLRTLTGRFGGKGGGRPELAQGGGLNAPPAELVAAARALVASELMKN
jgi:alanyl-tRNA synthetase